MRRRALLKGGKKDYSQEYFTMVVTVGGDITLAGSRNNLSYSKDNGNTWRAIGGIYSVKTISVAAGDKVLWKGSLQTIEDTRFNGTTNVRYSIEGNVMSLLFGDNFKRQTSLSGKNYALDSLFYNNTNVTSAENMSLPATTLANGCYRSMFYGCTSLTTAPELPATTLTDYCYRSMFDGCTSLTTAPELPATTLASNCYSSMFDGCTSLTTAPSVLPATTLTDYCYSNMFYNCTSLTTAPELPATTLASNCYSNMFYNTNVLPDCTNINFRSQSVVASGGLQGLFAGTKITDAQLDTILKKHGINNYSLPVTTLATNCYRYMFYGCRNLTTAPDLPATTLADNCYESMFRSCRNLTTAPDLPATTLASKCYYMMFWGSFSLASIKCLATNISASNCTYWWVRGVASSGTFTKKSSMSESTWGRGDNGIPEGWTVVDA